MSEITRKPLTWFNESPQIRKDPGNESDLKNLGENMKAYGQISPVGAMADGEVIYGFRRLKAARLVGLPDLEVRIYTEKLSETELKSTQLTENIHRQDMSPWEKWNACEELRKINPSWNAKELSEHLKLDPSMITKLLSPSRCIPEWQEALRSGHAGISDCYAASRVSVEEQRTLLALKLGGTSRDGLERAIRRTKPKKAGKGAMNRVSILLPSGHKVVLSGKKMSMTSVVEALSESLDAAKKGVRDRLDAKTWQSVMRDKSVTNAEGHHA